jgi:hypothetical protein
MTESSLVDEPALFGVRVLIDCVVLYIDVPERSGFEVDHSPIHESQYGKTWWPVPCRDIVASLVRGYTCLRCDASLFTLLMGISGPPRR